MRRSLSSQLRQSLISRSLLRQTSRQIKRQIWYFKYFSNCETLWEMKFNNLIIIFLIDEINHNKILLVRRILSMITSDLKSSILIFFIQTFRKIETRNLLYFFIKKQYIERCTFLCFVSTITFIWLTKSSYVTISRFVWKKLS